MFSKKSSNYKYPNFIDYNSRYKSFSKMDSNLRASKQLSEAGFFFNCSKSKTKISCFSCGANINYYYNCDIWKQHALECQNSCKYLTMIKGGNFVTFVKEEFINKLFG